MKRDLQATKAANFQDPGSFIFKDGREWLRGLDWEARKHELWVRSLFICEYIAPQGWRCAKEAVHPHHKIRKSIAHDDRLANLMALCQHHHELLHPEKRLQFTNRRAANASS